VVAVKQEAQLLLADVKYNWHKKLRSVAAVHAALSRATGFVGRILRLLPSTLPFDATYEGNPLELSGSYLAWDKLERLGWTTIWWRSRDGRLGRLGTIHQRDRHTDSHVAIANAAPKHCVGRQTDASLSWPTVCRPTDADAFCDPRLTLDVVVTQAMYNTPPFPRRTTVTAWMCHRL